MRKLTTMISALVLALSTFVVSSAADKPVLDVIVNGSKTGNSMKMGVMLQEMLTLQGYDSEIVHTGGCVNTNAYMAKDTRPGFFLYSGSAYASDARKDTGCILKATEETFIGPFFFRSQAMCTLKSNNFTSIESFLKGKKRVTIAAGSSWPNGMFNGLEKQFGVDFVEVRYKGSGSQLKGLLAGDTDLLFTGYTKREIKNPDVNCFAVSGDIDGKAKFSDIFPKWNLANIGEFSYAHAVNVPEDRMDEVKSILYQTMKVDGKIKDFMTISQYTPGYVLDASGVGIADYWSNATSWGANN